MSTSKVNPAAGEAAVASGAPATLTDAKWCECLLAEGEAAPKAVMEELRAFVLRAIQSQFSQRRDCDAAFIEDVTQDATLRILQGLSTFRGDSRFTTWATTVAIRVAFSELRRARWKDVSLNQLLDSPDERVASRYEPASKPDGAETDADRHIVLTALKQVMRTDLTDRQRTAIEASLAGMAFQEVADRLNTNSNALYKLVHDARKKLKQGLLERGITEQDVRSVLAG